MELREILDRGARAPTSLEVRKFVPDRNHGAVEVEEPEVYGEVPVKQETEVAGDPADEARNVAHGEGDIGSTILLEGRDDPRVEGGLRGGEVPRRDGHDELFQVCAWQVHRKYWA